MALFPKVRLKWREPKGFLKERYYYCRERKGRIWWKIVGVVIIALLMIAVWFLGTLNPTKNPPSFEIALLLAISCGLFVIYVGPWIHRLIPSEIGLTDDAIFVRGNQPRSAKWKDISSITFAERSGFRVLRLKLCNGGDWELGLDSSMPEAEISSFLDSLGVSMNNNEQDVTPEA